ncbi:hypothetical protein CLOSS21_01537 [Clostridium sp. SS2/1]|nr:hypothetical protein CLOSS21_01537 [Clostridium sp. SS2/1]
MVVVMIRTIFEIISIVMFSINGIIGIICCSILLYSLIKDYVKRRNEK